MSIFYLLNILLLCFCFILKFYVIVVVCKPLIISAGFVNAKFAKLH